MASATRFDQDEGRGIYPKVEGGDVEIVLTTLKIYTFHSVHLRSVSTPFSLLLHNLTPAKLNKATRDRGVTVKYRLYLDDQRSDGTWGFLRDELNEKGKSTTNRRFGLTNANGTAEPILHTHLDMVFRCMKNVSPKMNLATLGDTMADLHGMLLVTEQLEVINLVKGDFESALIHHGQTLWRAIASNPVMWMTLSFRIRSLIIYKESMIHAVGRFNMLHDQRKLTRSKDSALNLHRLLYCVYRFVKRKRFQLEDMCRDANQALGGHYQEDLRDVITNRANRLGPPQRSDYGRYILGWMALSAFRHWLSTQIAAGKTYEQADGGYQWYTNIAKGGQAYLNHNEVESFLRQYPMPDRAKNKFHNEIEHLKVGLRDKVAPLFVSECQLDVSAHPVNWLTCLKVDSAKDWRYFKDYYIWGKQEIDADHARYHEFRGKIYEREKRDRDERTPKIMEPPYEGWVPFPGRGGNIGNSHSEVPRPPSPEGPRFQHPKRQFPSYLTARPSVVRDVDSEDSDVELIPPSAQPPIPAVEIHEGLAAWLEDAAGTPFWGNVGVEKEKAADASVEGVRE